MRHSLAIAVSCGLLLLAGAAEQARALEAHGTHGTDVPVEEGWAETPDGVSLYYRIAGSGEETVIAPFALYHGTTLDPLAHNRRIVTYDPRGRGRSDSPAPENISLDWLLQDLDTVRAAVGAERIALIGWSGGGQETFIYTQRNPERVTRLVQLAPVGTRFDPFGITMMEDRDRRTDLEALAALTARNEAGEFADDPAAHCRAEAAITNPGLLADPADAALLPDVCVHPNEHAAALGPYFGTLFATIIDRDSRDHLDEVTIPRLVIHAAQDNIPLEASREWVSGQANARLLVIEDSGHFPLYEQPEATLSAIATFLDGDWPDGAITLP